MHRFFLIRHGESQANAGLATSDPKSAQLTLRGHEQAQYIAAFLKKYTSLNLIVTSAYLRTKQTAAPTKETFRIKTDEEWEVQEFTYLSPGYLGHSTINDRRPLVDAYWEQRQPFSTDGSGSESFHVFTSRVQGFIRQLKDRHENIAVFSHEQFILAALWFLQFGSTEMSADVMQAFRDFFDRHRLPNGAIVEITVRRWRDDIDTWTYKWITQHLSLAVPGPGSASVVR